jgi:hypothetical protein
MKLEIRNIDVAKVISFLENENFKGIKSVMRSKITNYLTKQLQEIADGEKTIREDFKDDPNKLDVELKAYFNEKVVVSGDNFVKPLNVIKEKVKELTSEECEREFSGNDAYALSVLYEAFELGGEDE